MRSRLPTLKIVAEAAGVHVSTVSRALDSSKRHLIGPDVLKRIEETALRLGYRRDMAAAALRTHRSRLIGVVVPDIANPVFAPIIAGITSRMSDGGYSTIVADVGQQAGRQDALIDELTARRVDGLILATARIADPGITELIRSGMPMVLVNRSSDGLPVPAVTSDDRLGMRLIVQHLAQLGHRRIAHLAGPQAISTGRNRKDGFVTAMQEAGLPVLPSMIAEATAYDTESGEIAALHLLQQAPFPTAIAAANDLLAIGVLRTLRDQGLSCPDSISVTGFNDMPLVDMIHPPLTTIRIKGNDMGREAAELLLQRIDHPAGPFVRRMILPELMIRRSTLTVS
jgi:LacI family transcriptional regulator